MSVFQYTFPGLAKTYACGNQTVSIDNQSTDLVTVSEYDPEIDGYAVTVQSNNRVGIFERQFLVQLFDYPAVTYVSAPFSVIVSQIDQAQYSLIDTIDFPERNA